MAAYDFVFYGEDYLIQGQTVVGGRFIQIQPDMYPGGYVIQLNKKLDVGFTSGNVFAVEDTRRAGLQFETLDGSLLMRLQGTEAVDVNAG